MAVRAEVVAEATIVEHRRGFRRRWYRTPSFVAGSSILGAIVLLALVRAARDDPRPRNPGPAAHPRGPVAGAPARHRRPRPRRLVAPGLRRAHRPPGRIPRRALPVRDRDARRPGRRLLRRRRRHAHELARQRRRRVPVLRADHRARLRARIRDSQHLHRDHDRRLGVVHADRARRGAGGEAARVRARRPLRRPLDRAHPLPAPAAERRHPGDRLRDVRHRARASSRSSRSATSASASSRRRRTGGG